MARRRAGRHARTIRRFTPRRWLPFVALIVLAAAAVVISEQVDTDDPVEVRLASPEHLLPVAAVPDSVSATWFCGGGTATGEGEGADLSVVIANAGDTGAEALVTYYSPEGDPSSEEISVPVNGRVRVTARDVLEGDWSASTVEVFGGRATVERRVVGDDGFDQAPCASAASDTWYLPSGSTLRGSTEQIFLFNPFPDTAAVDIRFATDEGALAPQSLTGIAVPARSLQVVTLENPARRKEVSAIVTTRTGRIAVDRLQTHDGSGDPVAGSGPTPIDTDAPRGMASTPAIATPSARWFWPDARIVQGGRTQLAILNPDEDDDAELELLVGFDDPELYTPIAPIKVSVPAGEQTVLDLSDDVDFQHGMELTLDLLSTEGVRVVAELVWHTGERETQALPTEEDPDSMGEEDAEASFEDGEEGAAADDGAEGAEGEVDDEDEADDEEEHDHDEVEGPGFTVYAPGFAVTAGSPVGARAWFVAGTGASSTVTSEIVVANPSAGAVEVTVTELVDGSQVEVAEAKVTVPARGRVTLDLSTMVDAPSAVLIEGRGPLVVSRTLWATEERGTSVDLATPLPDQVVPLPSR